MGIATTIGLDIAKSVFQVLHGVDAAGEVVIRRKADPWAGPGVVRESAPMPRRDRGMQSSHYWARELIAQGYDVRLLPARYLKA